MAEKVELSEPLRLWVEALRSGKYKQGRQFLFNDGRLCCLGVACEVYRQQGGNLAGWSDLSSGGQLPVVVAEWLGVNSVAGDLLEGVESHYHLIGLNDRAHYTFGQIADVIEAGKLKMREPAATT